MKTTKSKIMALITACVLGLSIAPGYSAETKDAKSPEMKKMMEAAAAAGAVNENHKLLESFIGNWDYRVKMWMQPNAPVHESTGIATTTSILGGRFIQSNHSGKMEMPVPDGKMVSHDFQGIAIQGYNNMRNKFFTTWMDNMNTAMTLLEGTYDSASKSFTYQGSMDCPMTPKTPIQAREVIKVIDSNTHVMEWYDTRTGKETKVMEITYTRKK